MVAADSVPNQRTTTVSQAIDDGRKSPLVPIILRIIVTLLLAVHGTIMYNPPSPDISINEIIMCSNVESLFETSWATMKKYYAVRRAIAYL